jgi:hypothetical protein
MGPVTHDASEVDWRESLDDIPTKTVTPETAQDPDWTSNMIIAQPGLVGFCRKTIDISIIIPRRMNLGKYI